VTLLRAEGWTRPAYLAEKSKKVKRFDMAKQVSMGFDPEWTDCANCEYPATSSS